MLTKGHYYKLIFVLLTVQVGPGTFCSCLTRKFGEEEISNLYCAVKNNDAEMVNLLKTSNGTFTTYGTSTTIHQTVNQEYNEKLILTDSKTALYLAVEKRYYEIVKIFLSDENLNINEESTLSYFYESYSGKNDDKSTLLPIHVAVEAGDDQMLELLLKYPRTLTQFVYFCRINQSM